MKQTVQGDDHHATRNRQSSSRKPDRLLALLMKEAVQVTRDPSAILIAFVLPLVLLFLFAFGISLDVDDVRIGVVNQSEAAAAEDLAAAFEATPYFDVRFGTDRRQFEEDLVAGRLRGIVVIPEDFDTLLLSPGPAPVQVIADGSEPNTASFVINYSRGVLEAWSTGRRAEGAASPPSITLETRFWFNPELTSRFFLVPGSIAIVMTLIGTLLTALVVAREWERGTMEAIMATPVSIVELLVGKLAPYFALGLGAMLLCTGIAVVVLGVPFRGSLLALIVISSVFLVPALGQGLLISAATKNQFVACQLALITGFLPAFLLSGFLFEIASMPPLIQAITFIVPARYLVPSIQTVFLAGDVWSLIVPDLIAIGGLGAVYLALAARATRKSLD